VTRSPNNPTCNLGLYCSEPEAVAISQASGRETEVIRGCAHSAYITQTEDSNSDARSSYGITIIVAHVEDELGFPHGYLFEVHSSGVFMYIAGP
jgi:hypothetical protein